MLPEKQILKLRAAKGLSVPVVYKGVIKKIVRDWTELEISHIPHESMIHIETAIKEKALEKFEGDYKK